MSQSICIFGDAMLDVYVHCNPDRVSSEAPVIIAREVKRSYAPGGAANVAASLTEGFGLPVKLAGFVGDDQGKARLVQCLIAHGIDPDNLVTVDSWKTIEKTRFVDGLHRQMLRVDTENPVTQPDPQAENLLGVRLSHLVNICDTLIISDYAKGTCTPRLMRTVLGLFREAGKFIVANGKPQNFSMYAGASVLILNYSEAVQAHKLYCQGEPYNGTDFVSLAGMLHKRLESDTDILITMGDKGMVWWSGNDFRVVPAIPVEVADVTGAGDTVTATIAAHGGISPEILEQAAINAAEVVGQHGSSLGQRRPQ